MQEQIIRFFDAIATPVLDALVQACTMLGEQTVFILFISWMLWCGNKRKGFIVYSMLLVSLVGMGAIKALVRAPRPFQVLEGVVGKRLETATGYSFPSGHTTGAASFYSALAIVLRSRAVTVLCMLAIALVAVSRLYLAVHWPIDVVAGIVIGSGTTVLLHTTLRKVSESRKKLETIGWITGLSSLLGSMVLAFLVEAGFADPVGFTDLVKLLALAGGGYLGFAVDNRSMGYSTQGTLPVKLVRYIIGVAAILLIQASKPLLPPHLAFSALRYITTGLWATALYPAIGSRIRTGGSSTLFSVAS